MNIDADDVRKQKLEYIWEELGHEYGEGEEIGSSDGRYKFQCYRDSHH